MNAGFLDSSGWFRPIFQAKQGFCWSRRNMNCTYILVICYVTENYSKTKKNKSNICNFKYC